MIELLALSIALSMDAFAVSIALGIKSKHEHLLLALKAAFLFGLFQALMPLVGYGIQSFSHNYLLEFNTYIAAILLFGIGGKMIYESFDSHIEDKIYKITNRLLFTLAIATSIDAMAAGFTLHYFQVPILVSVLIIGITTFFFSLLGVYFGIKGATILESKAERIGGIILIAIGLKLLYETL